MKILSIGVQAALSFELYNVLHSVELTPETHQTHLSAVSHDGDFCDDSIVPFCPLSSSDS